MQVYYFIGIICIFYGIQFALKGPGLRSKPRLLVGTAMCLVGGAQFFRTTPWLGFTLLGAGLAAFVAGLALMRGQVKRRGPG